MLENSQGAIKKGQSRETGNIGHTKQKDNTICVGHHYRQTNRNHVNKTSYKQLDVDEPNIVFMQKS